MANSLGQGCPSVPNMGNLLPLPPKFVSLMKSVRKAKVDAETFASKIDLLARQYSRGFGEILREGEEETRDGVICDIAIEMDVEVSRYSGKLEDFKTKLKNVFGNHDNNSQSKDGPLPGDSPLGIQEELRDRLVKLQQQILDMENSNTAFQKRFEDATAQNAERVQEMTALQGEALDSNRKLKDDLMRIPVRPIAATVDQSVQTCNNDFFTKCSQLESESYELMYKYMQMQHEYSLEAVKEEMLEEITILDTKIDMEICKKAGSVAHLRCVKSLSQDRVVLAWMKTQIEHPNIIKFQTPLAT